MSKLFSRDCKLQLKVSSPQKMLTKSATTLNFFLEKHTDKEFFGWFNFFNHPKIDSDAP